MKAVILIIDAQQDFFQKSRLKDNRKKLAKNINKLTMVGRSHDVPIVWVRQVFKKDLSDAFLGYKEEGVTIVIENTPGSQLLPELKKHKNDHEVIKKRYSAFFNTSLNKLLKKLDADTLIIGGVNTHACIRMTAIDAYQYDYKVILATDCIDSCDEEFHKISLKYLTRRISTGLNNGQINELLK